MEKWSCKYQKQCRYTLLVCLLVMIGLGISGNVIFAAEKDDFEIQNGTLIHYYGSSEVVVIPDQVTSIGRGAFYNNSKVKTIKMSN